MPVLLVAVIAFVRAVWLSFRDPKFRGLFFFVFSLILVGTIFYHYIEGWSYLDAAYFCVSTLATVGFGDITPTTTIGKVFTIFFIIFGIGAFLAFVNALVTDIAKRREGRQLARRGEEGERAERDSQ